MTFMGPIIARPRDDIYAVLKKLGLTANLHSCLDAGDEISAPASTNKWVDLSGGGNGFWRGTSSSSEASLDMDFVGTVGRRDKDTYWENGGGGETFEFEKAITATYRDAHKNNQSWALCGWYYIPATGEQYVILDTAVTASQQGIWLRWQASNDLLSLSLFNGSGTAYLGSSFSSSEPRVGWNFVALSAQIASGVTLAIHANARRESALAGATTGSPSSGTPPYVPTMVDRTLSGAGMRINSFCFWAAHRTLDEFEAIFQATRGKFGV